jgi:ferredoxin-type protein NapF
MKGRVAGPEAGKSRRRFMSGGMSAALGAVILPADSAMIRAAQAGIGTRPVTPPGSVGIKHFSSHCTACHLCVSACPTGVLRPSLLDYGIAGFLQPRMDFRTGSCTYDCVLCSTMCPSGAILPLTPDRKKEIQAGTARFVKEDCIVETKKKDCSACSEHCPTKAVYMVPYGALMLPELNNELCVGCGACEHACPTIPRKAIFVISSEEHGRAKKPVIEKKKPAEEVLPEFPF